MAVNTETILSKPDLMKHMADGFRDTTDLMLPIGVAAMAGMATQLVDTYSTHSEAYRTQNLLRSIQVHGPGQGGNAHTIFDLKPTEVTVGSSVKYARIQSEGGTIKPRTVKALAIPLTRQLKVANKWPRDYPKDELSFIPAKSPGKTIGYLVDEDGSLGFGEGPLFALVRSVTIRPKHLARAGREYVLLELDGIYEDWVNHIAEAA
jgi:hypothetical protein